VGIGDVAEIVAGPAGAGEFPLEIAMSGRMRKIEKRVVYFGDELAEGSESFGRVRGNVCERGAGKVGEEPGEASGIVAESGAGEELILAGGNDARKSEMRSA